MEKVKNDSFVRVHITSDIYQNAMERAESLPVFPGSHRKEEANIVGCLGEVIFEKVLSDSEVPFTPLYTTKHDLQIVNGMSVEKTLEVKTKDRTVAPRPNYEATLPAYNHDHQVADYYGFVSLQRGRNSTAGIERFHSAWVVGVANRAIFDRHKKFWKAGQQDPTNGTVFWTDCWNLYIDQLAPIFYAINQWKATY
jgi:hypothetical protein